MSRVSSSRFDKLGDAVKYDLDKLIELPLSTRIQRQRTAARLRRTGVSRGRNLFGKPAIGEAGLAEDRFAE